MVNEIGKSRIEAILENILGADNEILPPMSRNEELLIAILESGKLDPDKIKDAVDEWLDEHPEATTTVEDGSITYDKLHSSVTGDIRWLKSITTLQEENIPDTTQTITFDGNGNVSQIVHTDGNNVAIRTDVFTFAANSITEVRTLNTGESLTIVTDTDTLTTTVTYAAA